MNWLNRILNKKERLVVGLMSGTSMDGIDAGLLRIKGSGLNTKVDLIKFISIRYETNILQALESVLTKGSTEQISELNFLIGEAFADAAITVIKEAGFKFEDIDLIGSHGQTIYHNPPSSKNGTASTLQIGELDVIAERTGITTVGDFRTRDVAAGGEGAPLVPYVDYLLFHEKGEINVAQNIGGIANATVITEKFSDVMAFDTGPGNLIMNGVMSLATKGNKKYDKNGELAAQGSVHKKLLDSLLSDPYFKIPPPKSTGGEIFGMGKAKELHKLVKDGQIKLSDLTATLLELTVESIALSYEKHIFPNWEVKEVILSGGGCRNPLLLRRLENRLKSSKISTSDSYGIPIDAKEAVAFSILANELISGNCTNLPSVTGAHSYVPLGKIAKGRGDL